MRLGTTELILILAVVLLLFGPSKLPELAKSMGEAVREFRKGQQELDKDINEPVVSKAEDKTAQTETSNKTSTETNSDANAS